jgi:hypothetical protein
VAEAFCATDLALMTGYQAGVTGAALIEFALDAYWRHAPSPRERVTREARPPSHADVWDGLVDAAARLGVTDTVVRCAAPLRMASPMAIRRCLVDLNPQQVQAILNSHANLVSVLQGPPGTGKTTTLAHLVASHLDCLQGGAFIVVCAHTHAAVDVAFCRCRDIFKRLNLQVNISRLGDPMCCFRHDTSLRRAHCASTGLHVHGFRHLGRRKRAHLDAVRQLAGSKFQVVFCTNSYVTHLYDPAAQNYGPAALVVSDESSQATR